jgi:hypothetical protein
MGESDDLNVQNPSLELEIAKGVPLKSRGEADEISLNP